MVWTWLLAGGKQGDSGGKTAPTPQQVFVMANKGRAEAGKALEAARVAETEAASHRATAAQKQKQIAELEVSCNVCMLGQRAGKRRLRTVFPAVLKRRQKLAGTVRSLPEGRCLSFVREVN